MRSGRRVDPDHLEPATGEEQCEGAGSAPDVHHPARAEFLSDVGVHLEIPTIGIERVDADEARMLEDRVYDGTDHERMGGRWPWPWPSPVIAGRRLRWRWAQ